MLHLPKDDNGIPIPVFLSSEDREARKERCWKLNECYVSGKKIGKHPEFKVKRAYIITGKKGLEKQETFGVPMHKECAQYSLRQWPEQYLDEERYLSGKNEVGQLFVVHASRFEKMPNGAYSYAILGIQRWDQKEGVLVPAEEYGMQ